MMTEHLPKVLEAHNLNMIYFMLTDILAESTELLCVGTGARGIALSAFDLPDNAKSLTLKGVVSRKKQLIPVLVETMQDSRKDSVLWEKNYGNRGIWCIRSRRLW